MRMLYYYMINEPNKNPAIDIESLIRNDIKRICGIQQLVYQSDLTPEYLEYLYGSVDWEAIPYYIEVCEDFIDKFSDNIIKWIDVSAMDLSIDFIRKYKDKINFCEYFDSNYVVSIDFIREFQNYINWEEFDCAKFLFGNSKWIESNDKFVKEFSEKIDFEDLIRCIDYYKNFPLSKETIDYCRMFT